MLFVLHFCFDQFLTIKGRDGAISLLLKLLLTTNSSSWSSRLPYKTRRAKFRAFPRDVALFPSRDAVAHQGRCAQDHARRGQGAALGEALDHYPRHHHEDLQVGRHREEENQAYLRAGVCRGKWRLLYPHPGLFRVRNGYLTVLEKRILIGGGEGVARGFWNGRYWTGLGLSFLRLRGQIGIKVTEAYCWGVGRPVTFTYHYFSF